MKPITESVIYLVYITYAEDCSASKTTDKRRGGTGTNPKTKRSWYQYAKQHPGYSAVATTSAIAASLAGYEYGAKPWMKSRALQKQRAAETQRAAKTQRAAIAAAAETQRAAVAAAAEIQLNIDKPLLTTLNHISGELSGYMQDIQLEIKIINGTEKSDKRFIRILKERNQEFIEEVSTNLHTYKKDLEQIQNMPTSDNIKKKTENMFRKLNNMQIFITNLINKLGAL